MFENYLNFFVKLISSEGIRIDRKKIIAYLPETNVLKNLLRFY